MPAHRAPPLDDPALAAIRRTACVPRVGRGGTQESPSNATARGLLDIALCALASDAGLRRAELARVTWESIERAQDGTGRLTGRRSNGRGDLVFLSRATMLDLDEFRPDDAGDQALVFALAPASINRRLAAAALAAGLGPGYSIRSGKAGQLRRAAAALTHAPT